MNKFHSANEQREDTGNGFRNGWGFRAVLLSMLMGAVVVFGSSGSGWLATFLEGSDGLSTEIVETETQAPPADPFTSAQVGQCINWNLEPDGALTDFAIVECTEPHMYEVTERVDLKDLPEFRDTFPSGADAPTPDELRALRDDVCMPSVLDYLDGRFDPQGKFAVAPMLPPSGDWNAGDRTMLCGIQLEESLIGTSTMNHPATLTDQAITYEPGVCVAINENGGFTAIDCGEPHAFESVGVVDLLADFPDDTPSVEEQNALLSDVCVARAIDYLGGGDEGDEALYQSTLIPFWLPVTVESWDLGSHSTTCWLAKDSDFGGFSTLQGSALGEFTIDGAPPAEQPERAPRREDVEDGDEAGAAPAEGAPAGAGAGE